MAGTGVRSEVPSLTKSVVYDGPAPGIVTDKQCYVERLKTTAILMEWPIVHITVDKIQTYYKALKSSSKLLNWSCEVSEKLVTSVYDRSGSICAVTSPALKLADSVASEVAGTVQTKLPVVRRSPSELYDAMKSSVWKVVTPFWDKIEIIANSGERRVRRTAIKSARTFRKFVIALDKWIFELEKGLHKSSSKGVRDERTPGGSSVATKLSLPLTVAFRWSMAVAMFSVGATAWAISRVPVVGKFVGPSPSPASSKSASPVSDKDIKLSSSSYESIPDSAPYQATVKMRRSMLNLENQGLY